MNRTLIAAAIFAALTGCAQKPPVDTTPENPTAVFETRVSSSGIAGNFPFETTEKRYVRADMRRDERNTKGTGRFSGYLVTRLAGGPGDTHIARLDRKVLWTVNERNKEYFECPISGCPMPAGAEGTRPEAQKPQAEQPKQKTEEGCTVRVASSRFDVKPTGQRKDVNGFNAEQYEGSWVVRMEDKQKRATTSTVKWDVWTTAVNGEMKKALDTEEAFGRAFMAAVPRSQFPEFTAKPGERPVLPPETLSMMTAYLGNVSAADRAAFARAAKELEKIKGHLVYSKMDWFLEGNACGAEKEEQQPRQQSSTDMVVSGVMGLFSKKEEKPAGPQPLFSFVTEVKQMAVVPVRDSTFNVPPNYKKAN